MVLIVRHFLQCKSLAYLVILIFGLLDSSTARFKFGLCSRQVAIEDFNATTFFNGRWYEIKSYGNIWFEGFGTCSGLVSTIAPDGEIILKTYNYQPLLGTYVSIDGTSQTQYILNNQGSLPINFGILGGVLHGTYEAQIVDTDYTDFAVIYLCQQGFLFKTEMAYVLSRNLTGLDAADSSRITSAVQKLGLRESAFKKSINYNCGPKEPNV